MNLGRLLVTSIFLMGCSNGTPQVEFLKKLLSEELFPGIALKINSSTNAIGNTAAPVIVVSGFSDSTKVELFTSSTCDSAAKVGESTTATSDTTVSLAPTALTTDGVYEYYAKVTSTLGIVSDCSKNKVTYTYDNTAPVSPSAITLVTIVHNTATPELQVAGVEVGTNVSLYADAACTTPAGSSNGTVSSATVNITSLSVVEGTHSYYAKIVDSAGNSSPCSTSSASYVYDITPPAVPNSVSLATGTVSPSNNINPSFDISTLVVGDTVKIFSDSLCLTELNSATVTTSPMTLTTVPALTTDGTYQIHAKALDPYGNASACSSATVAYVLDKTAPAKPSALALNTPATSPGNNPTPVITVSGVVVGDTVKLYSSATCLVSVATGTVSTGTSINLTSSTLIAEGGYEFYAEAIDSVGNTSGCSTVKVNYEYDITPPPSKPTTLTLANPATSPGNNATPTFSVGSGLITGDTVKLYSDASCTTAVSSPIAVSAGMATVSLSSALTVSGSYTYYANATDPAGNATVCSTASVTYVFDNVAPTTPSALALSTPSSSPGNVTAPILLVSGTTSGDTISIYTDASCTALVTSTTAAAASTTVTLPTLTEGSYNFYAKAKDPAGNASGCTATPVAYVLDLTAPANPSSLVLNTPATNPGNLASPIFQVNGVIAGDTVGLYQDAVCTSLVTSNLAAGTSILLTSGAISGAGTYQYYTASTDPAGNKSGCVGPTAYTYDNVAPTVLNVTSSNVDRTYGPGATINITLNMSEVVTVNTSTGTPTLVLNTTPSRVATYANGSGTAQLNFTYTVQPGDSSADLDYASTSSFLLNAAVIKDVALNNLSTTLLTPGGSSSLALTRAIVISPTPPAVTLVGSPTMRLNEGAGAQTMTLSLSFPATYNMTVNLFSYGNALIGVDYMLSNNLINIPAGSTSVNFTFTPLENATVDIPRRLMLSIDSVNGDFYGMLSKVTQKDIYLIDNDQTQIPLQLLPKNSMSTHQCVAKSDGSMYCWGANVQGQLGDNTSGINKATPVPVTSMTAGWGPLLSAATGGLHSCAVKGDQSLWCWGNGSLGQLGLGSTSAKIYPFQVGGGSTYKKVAAGYTFTCAIKNDNTLWCWGSNSYRELGSGSLNSTELNPIQVSGADTYKDVFAGYRHACGITTFDELKCWGDNSYAQASGNGSVSPYVTTPTLVDPGVSYSKAALGSYHTCGITAAGALKCWGQNTSGQIGDNTTADKLLPTMIFTSDITDIAAGGTHTCGIHLGDLKCWGSNSSGQLGIGTTANRLIPDLVGGSVAAVAAGAMHTCALLNDNSLKCWGQNTYSQIGTGKEDTVRSMTLVETNYSEISQAENHSCGVTSSGAVRCWGTNTYGQVGDGTLFPRSSPVVIIPNGVSHVVTASHATCAVYTSGKLQCWGYNINGRLGDGTNTNRTRPTDILLTGVSKVAMGIDSTCALMTDGSAKCWGANNAYGKVGNGSTVAQFTPTQIIPSGATQIAVGSTHACAIVTGKVYCWGDNTYGQFGNLTTIGSTTPLDTSVVMDKISVGVNYTCGINAGDTFCWGRNNFSQLGDGSITDRSTPTQIDLGIPYTSITTNTYHTCGVTMGGSLKCWGNNSNLQMGSAGGGSSPGLIIGSSVASASVGLTSTCALMTNGYLNCVGGNSYGQLGLGNLGVLFTPLDVFGL